MKSYELVGDLPFTAHIEARNEESARNKLDALLMRVQAPSELEISIDPEWVEIEEDEDG